MFWTDLAATAEAIANKTSHGKIFCSSILQTISLTAWETITKYASS